jgi:hypothetical protein
MKQPTKIENVGYTISWIRGACDFEKLPAEDRALLRLMALYRALVRKQKGQVTDIQVPQVFYTNTWDDYKQMYRKLIPLSIPPALYIQAQFKKWPLDPYGKRYPASRDFCNEYGPTLGGMRRWEEYAEDLKIMYPDGDYRQAAELLIPTFDESFKDAVYKLKVFRKARPELTAEQAMVVIGDLLSPEYLAVQEVFVSDFLPRLDSKFDRVRKLVEALARDPFLKAELLDARRRICGG